MEAKNKKDYQNARIYTVRNTIEPELIYIGSTCQSLSKRMAKHRTSVKSSQRNTTNLYQKMNELGVENFYIELLHSFPCSSHDELMAEEGRCIREMGTLNMLINGRKSKEYYQDNKEHILDRCKNYYQENKEERLQYKKEYDNKNREVVLTKNREYWEANKEEINRRRRDKLKDDVEAREAKKESQRKHREANKEEINRKRREKRKQQKQENI